jgi:hypothetical protein
MDLELLADLARSLNEQPPVELPPSGPTRDGGGAGDRPGDDFNRRASWEDVLPGKGWVAVRRAGEVTHWRRPGKKPPGTSATTGKCRSAVGGDLLYVFSSNAQPFEPERCYSKFSAYALLYHGGDFAAAAADVARKGYGEQGAEGARVRTTTDAGVFSTFPTPGTNGDASPAEPFCFLRVPFSALRRTEAAATWLWEGYLARNAITLFSALWKAGKTTLLAHMVRAMEKGGQFCGLTLQPARVLYVTEEHESRWAERRDLLGIGDHAHAIIRPFAQKPEMRQWLRFLDDLHRSLRQDPVDVVVFDTLSNLWPVKDENDAAKVQEALMPLHAIAEGVAFNLVHHLRKADGAEATGSRGSGALPAFVDIVLELRRYNAGDRKDRRRVLAGYGRYEETPDELVLELTKPVTEQRGHFSEVVRPAEYVQHGDKAQAVFAELAPVIDRILPPKPPGLNTDQILHDWPGDTEPNRNNFFAALKRGAETGRWVCEGKGGKGHRHLYWKPPHDAVPGIVPYIGQIQDTEPGEGGPTATSADGESPF